MYETLTLTDAVEMAALYQESERMADVFGENSRKDRLDAFERETIDSALYGNQNMFAYNRRRTF